MMPGVMWSSLACRTSKGYSAISVAGMTLLPGSMKIFVDACPVHGHGSFSVATPDVALLSATMEGMVPSLTPCWSSLLSTPKMNWCLSLLMMLAICSLRMVLVVFSFCCID